MTGTDRGGVGAASPHRESPGPPGYRPGEPRSRRPSGRDLAGTEDTQSGRSLAEPGNPAGQTDPGRSQPEAGSPAGLELRDLKVPPQVLEHTRRSLRRTSLSPIRSCCPLGQRRPTGVGQGPHVDQCNRCTLQPEPLALSVSL